MLAGIRALTFDTGGTILDWHTGLCQALAEAGAQHGLSADWPEITNEYRRRSLKMMVSAVNPSFNIEDVHRRVLDAVIEEFGLTALTAQDRESIWRKWHALDTWPGFPRAGATQDQICGGLVYHFEHIAGYRCLEPQWAYLGLHPVV